MTKRETDDVDDFLARLLRRPTPLQRLAARVTRLLVYAAIWTGLAALIVTMARCAL